MRSKASDLASDIRNVMQIHQGKDQGVENGEHLGNRGNAHPTPIFSQGHITTPVEAIFHSPMVADQVKKPFC